MGRLCCGLKHDDQLFFVESWEIYKRDIVHCGFKHDNQLLFVESCEIYET